MTAWLEAQGQEVNHKRVARLLRQMGLMAVYPKPRLSQPGEQEEAYLKDYQTIGDAEKGLKEEFQFYNQDRLHQSLEYRTPAQVYYRS